jgi:ornithine cyclodeaminase
MSPGGPPWIGAAELAALLPVADAVAALDGALRAGLDPETDPPRVHVAVQAGELLLMPSWGGGHAGVKIASVAPGNAARGLPRIQGAYLLLDGATLAPLALLDAAPLTALRTSAVSAVAVSRLAGPGAARLLVFGTGPQAWGHVHAMRAVRPIASVDVAARDEAKGRAFVARLEGAGVRAQVAGPSSVEEADVVCCCTTAREPLFDGDAVADRAAVVAIGSHEPQARETDARLAARSAVVVESRGSALREAGDVLQAIAAGVLRAEELLTLADVVQGTARPDPGRPRLFKSTGMAWEDAVVAGAVADAQP